MNNYSCDYLVISCIDFRIHELVHTWLREKFPQKRYDYAAFAGGVNDLALATEQIEISKRLHSIQRLILIEHEDCGAYGKEGTREEQIQDLKDARAAASKLYPDLSIELLYLSVSGIFQEVL